MEEVVPDQVFPLSAMTNPVGQAKQLHHQPNWQLSSGSKPALLQPSFASLLAASWL